MVLDFHWSQQTLPCTSLCRGRQEQIAQVLVLKEASRLALTEPAVLRHVLMVSWIILHGSQSRRSSFQGKEKLEPQCHTALLLRRQGYLHVCSSLSTGRCRGNSVAWQWGLVSCLFTAASKSLPMPLLFHTLLPS